MIVERRDGSLWMLIRTPLDRFWSAFSSDGGRTWPILRPSDIEASSAPAGLIRLSVGIEDPDDLWTDLSQALDS